MLNGLNTIYKYIKIRRLHLSIHEEYLATLSLLLFSHYCYVTY